MTSLFQLMKDAGISPEDYEDRLTYLNNLSINDAVEVLGEWSGCDVKGAFQENFAPDISHIKKRKAIFRPIKTIKEVQRIVEEHQREGQELIKEVFGAVPSFSPTRR